MPLSIRTGLGPQSFGTSKGSNPFPIVSTPSLKVGKVMGVVTTNNTPTTKQFDRVGKYEGTGTVFFIDYNNSKNIDPKIEDSLFDICDIAKPLFPQFNYYPLLGELIYIVELPSPAAQITPDSTEKYYINSINLWNDSQVNSQTSNSKTPLGKTFIENSLTRNLLNYEGDHIIQGRKALPARVQKRTKTKWGQKLKRNPGVLYILYLTRHPRLCQGLTESNRHALRAGSAVKIIANSADERSKSK